MKDILGINTYDIQYMRNMWSSIPLVNSLIWAKKNSTSRIHPTKLTGKLQGGDNEKVSDIQLCPWTVSIEQLHLKNPPNEVDSGGELVALSPSLPLLLTYAWNLWLCLVYSSPLC